MKGELHATKNHCEADLRIFCILCCMLNGSFEYFFSSSGEATFRDMIVAGTFLAQTFQIGHPVWLRNCPMSLQYHCNRQHWSMFVVTVADTFCLGDLHAELKRGRVLQTEATVFRPIAPDWGGSSIRRGTNYPMPLDFG